MQQLEDRIRDLADSSTRVDVSTIRARAQQRAQRRRLTLAATGLIAALAIVGAGLTVGPASPTRERVADDAASNEAIPRPTPNSQPSDSPTHPTAAGGTAPPTDRAGDEQTLADLQEWAHFNEWLGTFPINYRSAEGDIGEVDGVTFRAEMTDSGVCITPSSDRYNSGPFCITSERTEPDTGISSPSGGGYANPSAGLWGRHFIVPSDIDNMELLHDGRRACELTPLSLAPYVDATLWTCRAQGDAPDVYSLRIEATRDAVTRQAVVWPQPGIGAPDTSQPCGTMPPFGAELTADQIDDLIDYIRSLDAAVVQTDTTTDGTSVTSTTPCGPTTYCIADAGCYKLTEQQVAAAIAHVRDRNA